jgi:nucleoid-associated protein YgaU
MRVAAFVAVAVAASSMFTAATPVAAQSAGDLMSCIEIARDADRLACYDAAVAQVSPQAKALSDKRAKETARIAAEEAAAAEAAAKAKAEADAAARAAQAKADFGAEGVASKKVSERTKPAPDEIVKLDAKLSEILTNREGKYVFLLDNGQLWRQVSTEAGLNIRPGDDVVVEKSTMGGYRINFVRIKRWVLVKRLR